MLQNKFAQQQTQRGLEFIEKSYVKWEFSVGAGWWLMQDLDIIDDLRPAPEVEDPKKKKNKYKQESGVAYIMPGKANITVIYGDKIANKSEFQIAQFGKTMQLPASMFED